MILDFRNAKVQHWAWPQDDQQEKCNCCNFSYQTQTCLDWVGTGLDHSAVKDCSLTTSNLQYFRGDKAGHSLLDIRLHVVVMQVTCGGDAGSGGVGGAGAGDDIGGHGDTWPLAGEGSVAVSDSQSSPQYVGSC